MKRNGGINHHFVDARVSSMVGFFETLDARARDEEILSIALHIAEANIYQAFRSIAHVHRDEHGALVPDTDLMVEVYVEEFLKPLERILPKRFRFGFILSTYPAGDLILELVDKDEIAEYAATIEEYGPAKSGAEIVSGRIMVIRMDK